MHAISHAFNPNILHMISIRVSQRQNGRMPFAPTPTRSARSRGELSKKSCSCRASGEKMESGEDGKIENAKAEYFTFTDASVTLESDGGKKDDIFARRTLVHVNSSLETIISSVEKIASEHPTPASERRLLSLDFEVRTERKARAKATNQSSD